VNTMAEVLAAHWRDSGGMSYGSPDRCVCGVKTLPEPGETDVTERRATAFAAHQADELTKAGYGKLADAWDEGRRVGHAHPYTQFTATPCPPNPYRSEP
jgi:hypothetical protein